MKGIAIVAIASALATAAMLCPTQLVAAPSAVGTAVLPSPGGGSCPYNYHFVEWGTDDGLMAGCAPGGGPAEFLPGDTPPPGTINIHPVQPRLP